MIRATYHKLLRNSYSIRWRLPLTYAGIALLTAIALGGLLLFTLRKYYNQREQHYLASVAPSLARQAGQMVDDQLSEDEIESAISLLAFIVQTRVQLLDREMNVVADSGSVDDLNMVNMSFIRQQEPPPDEEVRRPYLSIIPEPDSGSIDAGYRYPVPARRDFFGQIQTDETAPGKHSNQDITIAIHDINGALRGFLKLSDGPAFGSEIVEDVAEKGIVAGFIAILIAAAAGGFVSYSINQPVLVLADATQQMAHGNLSTRVTLNRRDEFGLLADTFNSMAERVETTVTTLKRFVEDAAHEINTPLTALRTNLELTTVYEMSGAARTDITKALAELSRLEKLTRSLLTLARLEAPGVVPNRISIDLTSLIRQIVEQYASRAEQAEIALQTDMPPESIMIQGDQSQITRMIDNLLDNALKFTPANGCISVGVMLEDNVRLWVQDTGIGIPAIDLPNLFSRFHRGRNAAAYPGNGLGLVIVKSIVEEHGGTIVVESGDGITRFTVQLPYEKPLTGVRAS